MDLNRLAALRSAIDHRFVRPAGFGPSASTLGLTTTMPRTSANAAKPFSRTPLHQAAIDANGEEIVRILSNGADVNSQDEGGWTALHFAAQSQSGEVVKKLLAAGADLELSDSHGNTALFRAVFSYAGDGITIQELLTAGADANAKNSHGVSPVELARNIASTDVSKFFSGNQGRT